MRVFVILISAFIGASACGHHGDHRGSVAQGAVVVNSGDRVDHAVALGGDLTVHGWVAGDVVALGGNVHLLPGSRVDGDALALGGTLTVEPGANLLGDRISTGEGWNLGQGESGGSPSWGVQEGSGGVQGGSVATALSKVDHSSGWATTLEEVGHFAGFYVLILLLGMVMLGVAPLRTRALAAAVAARPGQSLGLGLLVIVATSAAIVLSTLSIVGIPLALILGAVALCAACLGLAGVSILLGELVPVATLKDRPIAKLMLGTGLLALVVALPYVGCLFGVVAVVLGLGSLTVTRWRPGHAVFSGKGPYRTSFGA